VSKISTFLAASVIRSCTLLSACRSIPDYYDDEGAGFFLRIAARNRLNLRGLCEYLRFHGYIQIITCKVLKIKIEG